MWSNKVKSRRKCVGIGARAKSESFHPSYQLLCTEVAGRAWSEWTPAETADCRVEVPHPKLECLLYVRECRPRSVMEM
jgi:hypothetical protein